MKDIRLAIVLVLLAILTYINGLAIIDLIDHVNEQEQIIVELKEDIVELYEAIDSTNE